MEAETPGTPPSYGMSAHYDARFFAWQSAHADVRNRLKVALLERYVRRTDAVLDFGCAGGGVLGLLHCRRKIGVEINDVAREAAIRAYGIEAYRSLAEVPEGVADLVISSHTLEHLAGPYQALCELRAKLKPDGRLVLLLPLDDWRAERWWDPDDIRRHLYAWTPRSLGNLLDEAGFRPERLRIVRRALPRGMERYAGLPEPLFDALRWLLSRLRHRQDLLATARVATAATRD